MRTRPVRSRVIALLVASTAIVCASAWPAQAQSGRVLGREDIVLLGAGLSVQPARQTVPKDIATIVSTFLAAPDLPDQPLPPFAPDALVKATLRGPSFSSGIEITARPNTPFNIPPLSVPGIHTLDGIRLESGGEVILRGTPETVVIEVIEKLLVTQVTARALTAEEIRDRGIVFDRTNFQAYNFTAAFAIGNANPIPISFPIVLPRIQPTPGVALNEVGLPRVDIPTLPSLQTIIPETLALQTQIPNLSVVGFTLTVPQLDGQDLIVPPIPGIVVIPGDIGFLNQYFNVTLLVGNVAPIGSGLVVTNLSAEIVLPPGRDDVPNSGDDPLRMAQTMHGESQRVQLVVQPGVDGRLGTADDIGSLTPGDSGSAEYLVEGRREGSHVIEMEMTGTLNGLPVGPVTVRGRAAGSVLVRNPTFTLTFTHPELINAGEAYTLDVTVTNTSQSPANFVSVNLHSRNVTGAIVVGDPTRDIEFIAPGDSTTVSFDLIAQLTGPVTAATLDSDQNVEGRFALKTSVGELGIPLSPDSLVLPREANSLPAELRAAAIGLLGRAWAVATAPAAALPVDVSRFTKKIVFDRAIELAEAGFRYSLHEPIEDAAAHLWFDYLGNGFERLAERNTTPAALALAQSDYRGFDELRRRSIRGEVLADAVSAILGPQLLAEGATAFHRGLGEITSSRAGHVSVLVQAGGGPLPFTVSVLDAAGRQVGGRDAAGRVIKTIPFSDLLTFGEATAPTGQMALLASPAPGDYRIQLDRVDGAANTPYTLSILVPDASGALRHIVFSGLTAASRPNVSFAAGDPIRLTIDVRSGGVSTPGDAVAPVSADAVNDPPPHVIGAVQQPDADVLICELGGAPKRAGRVIALLFSEEVTPEAVQDRVRTADLTRYAIDGNQIVSVALQPGRRIAFLALRDPVGPLVPRTITIDGVTDRRGQAMTAQTVPIEMTVTDEAAVVSGQVLRADGTPAPFANVRLYYVLCGDIAFTGISPRLDSSGVGVSSKTTDATGHFSWDFVLKNVVLNRIAAIDSDTTEARTVPFTISRNGQRLNVNVVFLGRGTLSGRTVSEAGVPLANTSVKVTSLTDDTEYGATSDAEGRFTINRIPVGNLFIEAVNPEARATGRLAEYLSIANATVTRDVVLFSDDQPQVEVQFGTLRGFVLRGDGQQGVADVPVVAWYQNESQRGVTCPRSGDGVPPPECAIAVVRTNQAGEFLFDRIAAGRFRVTTLDRATFQQGEAGVILAANATQAFNILLAQGLGTVRGVVLDAGGARVPGARVGGGLSLTTANENGEFVLIDVPIGRREIIAVSDALQARGSAFVDLVRAGDEQNVTIVFDGLGSVAGRVFQPDGVTPAANARVHLFKECPGGCIEIVGTATTDAQGGYLIPAIKIGAYKVSSFRGDFTAGNVRPVAVVFNGQVARADIIYRGGGGRITGSVFDDDGQTPLPASVGISGDRVAVAGGQVGVGFQHVTNYEVTQTNFSTGAFAFNNIWVGPVTLRAVGQFSPDPIPFETAIPSPGAEVHVELRLQATAQIAGTVFQPDGVTPAGADVIVRFQSNAFKLICNGDACAQIPQGIQNFTVVTDAQGRYLFNPVNAGAFTITVEDPATGRVAELQGDIKPAQDAEFDIRLLQLATVTIRVRGSDGVTPIPGARVELRQTGFPRREITLIAGANGDAIFGGANALAEGEFAVLATSLANGFAGRVSGNVTAETTALGVNLFLFDAYGSVSGLVFGPDGLTPVANVEVLVRNDEGPLAFAVSDAAGHYRADIVPLGDVHVEAFEAATARRAFASGRVDFDDQEVPINLSQLGIGQVTGTLYQAGSLSPLKNWDVTLVQVSPTGHQFPILRTATGVDGSFSFPGATVGTFTIRATKTNVAVNGHADGDVVRHGQVVDVPIVVIIPREVNGRIDGRVVNPNGSAAANTLVTLESALTPATVTTDGDGRFTFDTVPVGRVTLRARSQVTANQAVLYAELQFEGETLQPTIVLVGLTRITGTVYRSDGVTPAQFVALELYGHPSSGCSQGACLANADAAGRFTFDNVPARTFTVVAFDEIAQLKGVVGDTVEPGQTRDVRIVLEPSAIVTGRALLPGNRPAQGVVVDVVVPKPSPGVDLHLFAVAGADGLFTFPAVPSGGPRVFNFADPIGPGIAIRNVQVLTGSQSIGDVLLDTGPPIVTSTVPAVSAAGVPLNSVLRLVFNEPLAPGSVTHANVALTFGGGPVPVLLSVDQGDTRVSVTPLSPLAEKTLYTLTVRSLTDRIGKAMTLPFITSFTSADLTPPVVSALSPAASANGSPIYAPVRITFNEPIDVTRFTAAAIALHDGATAVEGQIDFAFGNTVVVFTPLRPLREDATYRVSGQRATDLSGNTQPQGVEYTFTTTDRTPPVVTALVAAGNGTVIENAVTQVTAQVGAGHDVAFVDFYVNGVLTFTARTEPFTLNLLARPDLAAPGQQIAVAALATDTSGNRGTSPVGTSVTVIADIAPLVTILSPTTNAAFRNGERVNVTVRVTDDLGATQLGYRAETGRTQDAATLALNPSVTVREETFGFNIPQNAVPGSHLRITASALDTKGQATGTEVSLVVLDAVGPTVTITGTTTGSRVRPGQDTLVVVSAQDAGAIREIAFESTGVVARSETRPVDPAQPDVATSFTVHVPETANAGDVIVLRARATDVAGNTTEAAPVTLPVADLNAPTVTLRTSNGSLQAVPGRPVTVIVDAEDETGVSRVDLTGQGAFTLSDARAISPPIASASASFTINVPESAVPGTTLTLAATATDLFGNVSQPGTLVLTVASVAGVTMPPSLLTLAGDETEFTIELAEPAPAGGLSITLASTNQNVVTAITPVTIAAGATSQTARVISIAGGNATINAFIQGVQRASTTVTVQGGVVRGTVLDPDGIAVAGAQVTVTSPLRVTTTDANGDYIVQGIGGGGGPIVVKVLDPLTRFIGYATGQLNVANGSARINAVLIAAGRINGTVLLTDGETPAGAGVRVDLWPSTGNPALPLQTVFTDDDGVYEFPLVSLGTYRVDASDTNGNRGRATAVLAESGDEITVPIQYLGRGVVTGTVRSGGNPVPNVALNFYANSIFGNAPVITRNAEADGTFRFEGVLVGTFTVQAHDTVSNTAGSASGQISLDQQTVTANISLASYGGVQGRVYRSDGVTPVAGASVRISAPGASITTTTDQDGGYQFTFVPLGTFTVEASEPSTHGFARVVSQVSTHLQVVTADLVFLPQGTVVVTVRDFTGALVPRASVSVSSQINGIFSSFSMLSDDNGMAIFENVLAGSVSVSAFANGLSSPTVTQTLAGGGLIQVTVTLEPTANIVGTLFAPDGQTPISNGFVALNSPFNPRIPVAANGTFRFDGLDFGTYTLYGFDATQRTRAFAGGIVLNQNGVDVVQNLTMVGVGSVIGQVLNPGGSPAGNQTVTVRSLHPQFGGFYTDLTDANGNYEVFGVAAGAFVVTTGTGSLLGEASGTIAFDGEVVRRDIVLVNSAIALPTVKRDANNAVWDVRQGGHIGASLSSVFVTGGTTTAPQGGFVLEIVSNGTAIPFIGDTAFGTTEDGSREIAVRQQTTPIAGLSITRKAFVPRSHFARYLELLTNPTAAPITVDVRVRNNFSTSSGIAPVLVATSSGDAAFDLSTPETADRWAVVRMGTDGDAFQNSANRPSLAWVFDGPGAPRRASTITLQTTNPKVLSYTWTGVTIQPGQTIGFLHFGAQQYNQAAAVASAQRLIQLPPEALAGLSPDEIAAVQNFVIPAGGTSSLAALPGFGTTITGRMVEADGTTAMPNASGSLNVRLRSNSIYFGREYSVAANSIGAFTFTHSAETVNQVSLPLGDFTLSATYTPTNLVSPAITGSYLAGELTATRDIVFSNAAVVRGIVRRHTGAIVTTGGSIRVQNVGGVPVNTTTPIAADGSYRFTGVPAGNYTLTATLTLLPGQSSSFPLLGTAPIATIGGQTLIQDVFIVPTGTLTGTLRTAAGAVVPNRSVELRVNTAIHRTVNTSTGGVFLFTDVPLGTYTIRSSDPVTGFFTTATVVIAQDQTTVQDLTFIGYGTVTVTAVSTDGIALANASVRIRRSTDAPTQNPLTVGNTDATGHFTIPNVPIGDFLVRVVHPLASASVDQAGNMPANGTNVPVLMTLPAVSSLAVQVRTNTGAPVEHALVSVERPGLGFTNVGYTDANGLRTVTGVWGAYTVRVHHPTEASNITVDASGEVTASNLVIPVPVTMPLAATLVGVVRDVNGQPVENVDVQYYSRDYNLFMSVETDSDGAYEFEFVPGGAFRVWVIDEANLNADDEPYRAGSTLGVAATHGQVIQADIVLDDLVPPVTLTDGNNRAWEIAGNGSIYSELFNDARYALTFRTGVEGDHTFFGEGIAEQELGGRQLSIWGIDAGDAHLDMTRRVYVPADGYFVRYLDIFENVGNEPRTFRPGSVDEDRNTIAGFGHVINATSSGDTVTGTDDRWWVSGVPQTNGVGRAFARVLVGPGGALSLAEIVPFTGETTTYRWGDITLQPGERAAILHFAVESRSAQAAQAAAERLVQLPPEALAGLTADQLALIRNFDVPDGGVSTIAAFPTFSGRVLSGNGVTPIPGVTVNVTAPNPFIDLPRSGVTDAAGQYAIPYPAVADYALSVNAVSTTVSGQVPVGATSIVHDIVLATAGALRGVVRFNGTPVSTGEVRARADATGFVSIATIQADGTYLLGALEQGAYTLVASSAGRGSVALSQTIQAGVLATRDIDLTLFAGSITVRVLAADDQTTIPTGQVFIVDPATGQSFIGPLLPDENGVYTSPSFSTASGFRIRAEALLTTGAVSIVELNAAPFTLPNQVVPFTLHSTASVITGTILDADDDDVDGAHVVIRRLNESGVVESISSGLSDRDGRYVIFGVPAGPVVAKAYDYAPGLLTQEVSATLSGASSVIDFHLPPGGFVEVDLSGTAATVTLTSDASEPGVYAVQPGGGDAFFDRVPLGRFSVQACSPISPLICSAANGNLTQAGGDAFVALFGPFAGPGSFVGTLLDADGVTPLANRQVLVGAGDVTPVGGFETLTTNAAGQFRTTLAFVPLGRFVVSGADPAPSFTAMTLAFSVENAFNMIVGSGVPTTQTLSGSLGFSFPIGCDGTVAGGASPYPFAAYDALRINGLGTRCLLAARSELDGRQIVYGPITMGTLDVTRKVFVPADGSYVRYLEILTNVTDPILPQLNGPATVSVQLASRIVDPITVVQPAADTGNRFFVAEGGNVGSNAIADVFAGSTPAVGATVAMQSLGGMSTKRYTVTVPEGESRIVMHFLVLRAAGDHTGAAAQALSLATLADPNMLIGLTAAERVQIVNFVVP